MSSVMQRVFAFIRLSSYVLFLILFSIGLRAEVLETGSGYTIGPTTLNFGNTTIGLSAALTTVVTATGSAPITVSSMSFNSPGFQFTAGVFPHVLAGAGTTYSYTFQFVPTAAQVYSGSAIFTINGSPVTVTLNGTGITTGAVSSLSTTAMSFSQSVGTTSAAQSVTITNTGTTSIKVLSVTTQPPFEVTPLAAAIRLNAGASTSIPVTCFGSLVGSANGTLVISYDVLPVNGVTLSSTTTAATGFAISNYPALPLGTAGAAYLAQLLSANGTGTIIWSLTAGSSLPSGLSLSSSGAISGTVSSTAPLQTYSFTVQATDSNSNQATSTFSLQVMKPTGAACGDISWNVAGTSTPMTPITELGTATYFGSEGGLYDSGSNIPPTVHDMDGITLANQIQALDANGNPDPNGKYAVLGVGISTLLYEMKALLPMAKADKSLNSHLVFVNGAQAQGSATDFASVTSPYWTTITSYLLPNAGLTSKQVVAVVFEDIDSTPNGMYPADMAKLQTELEMVAQNVLTLFPNAKMLYYLPRIYSGYSGDFDLQDPEPYAYEYGFAIRGAVLDQIHGLASLNYKKKNGPVKAPWLSWGPYTWSNGMIARGDGLTYNCQDVLPDGRHPSPIGSPKVAVQMLNFFKTSDSTATWILAPRGN